MDANLIVKNLSKEDRAELLKLLKEPSLADCSIPEQELNDFYSLVQEMLTSEGCCYDTSVPITLVVKIEHYVYGFPLKKNGFCIDKTVVEDCIQCCEIDHEKKVDIKSFINQNKHLTKIINDLNKLFDKVKTKAKELKRKYKVKTPELLSYYRDLGYQDYNDRLQELEQVI